MERRALCEPATAQSGPPLLAPLSCIVAIYTGVSLFSLTLLYKSVNTPRCQYPTENQALQRVKGVSLRIPYRELYNPAMDAAAKLRVGRPRTAAKLDLACKEAQDEYEAFFGICKSFDYQDIMHLSNGLGINPRTVYAWKYGHAVPRNIRTMLIVLSWVASGKPTELEYQSVRNAPHSAFASSVQA